MVKRLSSLSQTGPIHDCSVSKLMHIYMVKYGKPFFFAGHGLTVCPVHLLPSLHRVRKCVFLLSISLAVSCHVLPCLVYPFCIFFVFWIFRPFDPLSFHAPFERITARRSCATLASAKADPNVLNHKGGVWSCLTYPMRSNEYQWTKHERLAHCSNRRWCRADAVAFSRPRGANWSCALFQETAAALATPIHEEVLKRLKEEMYDIERKMSSLWSDWNLRELDCRCRESTPVLKVIDTM